MKIKHILITILAILLLLAIAACNGAPEDAPEPDTIAEEVEQTPSEETTEPEPLPEPASGEEESDETAPEETVYPEYETLESGDEYEDVPEEDEDEPEVADFAEPEVVVIGADIDPELIGSWLSDTDRFEYLFNADGTGVRGVHPDFEEFSWHVEDDHVLMTFVQSTGFVTENWGYSVMGNTVMFTSGALPGQIFMFSRTG